MVAYAGVGRSWAVAAQVGVGQLWAGVAQVGGGLSVCTVANVGMTYAGRKRACEYSSGEFERRSGRRAAKLYPPLHHDLHHPPHNSALPSVSAGTHIGRDLVQQCGRCCAHGRIVYRRCG